MAQIKTPKNNGTPQAVDDILEVGAQSSRAPFVIGTIDQLLANDRGGDAKRFYGFDDSGSRAIVLDGIGSIEVDEAGDLVFAPDASWEGGEVTFPYLIQMGENGVLSSANVSFEASFESNPSQLITFDEIQGDPMGVPIPNGYAGLDWSNFSSLLSESYPPGTGYDILGGEPSDKVAYNPFGDPAALAVAASGPDFDFLTGDFAAAWRNDLQVYFRAYDDGVDVGTLEMVIDPTLVKVDFVNQVVYGADSATFTGTFASIDKLTMYTYGGTDVIPGGRGNQLAMDDWAIRYESTVP
jgi:hypothetical protein